MESALRSALVREGRFISLWGPLKELTADRKMRVLDACGETCHWDGASMTLKCNFLAISWQIYKFADNNASEINY